LAELGEFDRKRGRSPSAGILGPVGALTRPEDIIRPDDIIRMRGIVQRFARHPGVNFHSKFGLTSGMPASGSRIAP